MPFSHMTEQIDLWMIRNIESWWKQIPTVNAIMVVIAKWTPITMIVLIFLASAGVGIGHSVYHRVLLGHAVVAIIAAVAARLANEPISKMANKPRPFELHGFVPLLGHERGQSFPSNHATGALALATSMLAVPGYGPTLLGLAFLLCFARVYTGLHHLTDVVAGALSGVFWAGLCLFLYITYIPMGIGTS